MQLYRKLAVSFQLSAINPAKSIRFERCVARQQTFKIINTASYRFTKTTGCEL